MSNINNNKNSKMAEYIKDIGKMKAGMAMDKIFGKMEQNI